MKKDNRIYIVISIIGMIAVIWLALIIAPLTNGGLATIINELPTKLQKPFNITICENSSKTVLIFLLSYLIGIGAYFSTRKNYRKGKEHGSAKWGDTKEINKKYKQLPESENRILTQDGSVLAEETRQFTLVKYPTMIYVDTPSQGHITGRDNMEISGWIMSTYDDVTLKIYLDDVQLDEEITRRARQDVINSVEGYGGIETNPTPGFRMEIPLTSYPEGDYTIRVVAEKEDGTVLSSSTVDFSINRTVLRGIDISEHQGTIDWEKVKNEVDFVIIRCGYGVNDMTQDDEMFMRNISECKRLGIPYGVYIYSYAVDTDKAKSEAEHVRRLLTQAGDYTTPEYGIWFDMESDGYKADYNVTDEMYREIAHTFISEMNRFGYNNIGIYANLNWWTTVLNDESLDQYPKWVAQHNTHCDYQKDYIMWQYTSDGSVNGISGSVDMDYYYCYR